MRETVFRRIMRTALSALLGTGALAAVSVQALALDEGWNPQPLADDVILDLPCDQKIVFRKVSTPQSEDDSTGGAVLDDRRILLGWPSEEQGFLDYTRAAFISGAFKADGSRFYLLAKYETTVGQYAAVRGEACASPAHAFEAVTGVSWYDAVDYSRRLTRYLHEHAADSLEALLGSRAFYARLPTEVEWEYAVRGGAAVNLTDFQAERFPMSSRIDNYAWANLSSGGSVNEVGLLDPNPIGLHDMYGNASEMTLEPFKLNKAGRLHGLAGGFIVKGGSFLSGVGGLRSAMRTEHPYFDPATGKEKTLRDMGFRLAISGPALSDLADFNRLRSEWDSAGQSRLPADEDPVNLLSQMEETEANRQIRANIATVKKAIRLENASRNEREDRLLSSMLMNSGKLLQFIRHLETEIRSRKLLLAPEAAASFDRLNLIVMESENDEAQGTKFEFNSFNSDLIVRMVNEFDPDRIKAQAGALVSELEQRGMPALAASVRRSADICTRLAQQEDRSREVILELSLAGLDP
ncbi:SUMF1/EgtB/PvdO family nonheme iron enzyme [Breoghania sp. L-A4]|uniref:formylglycine-generating enzyme family protein n=1 Tax=Breoghania sp. L-A4 TaxID=2304600 RepID=UPI000E359D8E|nr:SUMF1/EgtB/PvdO family nonheme iron enzyme [Breoghania sp. L-A4]AXS40695.1 hypothetical protein D1F64_12285 [Breoghania sp. L-A4]